MSKRIGKKSDVEYKSRKLRGNKNRPDGPLITSQMLQTGEGREIMVKIPAMRYPASRGQK